MIEFKNVTKKFGDKTVLDNVSFQINEGEILFILGRSGTGKSVLLKNIVGLLKPDGGTILVDSVDITKISENDFFDVRKKCGMVFQQPALFDSMTVYENIAFGIKKHSKLSDRDMQKKIEATLGLVNLKNIEQNYPNLISYGMQKRVSLARTLAIDPQILLFDEPTTGLDPITTNSINALIKSLSTKLKTTSVVVSHDMHCALDIADRIIVLDGGKIIENASVEKIKQTTNPLVKDFLSEALQSEALYA